MLNKVGEYVSLFLSALVERLADRLVEKEAPSRDSG